MKFYPHILACLIVGSLMSACASVTINPNVIVVTPSPTAQAEGTTGYNYYKQAGTNWNEIAWNAPTNLPWAMNYGDVFAASATNATTGIESHAITCTNNLPSSPAAVTTK